jgi:hypothetical protein
LLDGALDQVALGIAGDLARAVDGAGRLDGLGLRSWSELRQMCIVWALKTYVGAGSCKYVSDSVDYNTRMGGADGRTRSCLGGEDGSGRHGVDRAGVESLRCCCCCCCA